MALIIQLIIIIAIEVIIQFIIIEVLIFVTIIKNRHYQLKDKRNLSLILGQNHHIQIQQHLVVHLKLSLELT